MLYIFLKNIIETTIEHYNCQSCHRTVDESAIQITGIGDHLINLDVVCSHCHTHAHIHAEIANIANEMIKTDEWKALLKKVMKHNSIHEGTIKDEDINTLKNELSSAQSIEDFLK